MRQLIALRRKYRTFGRGTMEIIRPENRAIFAFLRSFAGEDPILVVANLSKTVQPVSLDLSAFAGWTPTEMSGGIDLPTVTAAPYFLTLGPHAFYWLQLKRLTG